MQRSKEYKMRCLIAYHKMKDGTTLFKAAITYTVACGLELKLYGGDALNRALNRVVDLSLCAQSVALAASCKIDSGGARVTCRIHKCGVDDFDAGFDRKVDCVQDLPALGGSPLGHLLPKQGFVADHSEP